MNFTFNSYSHDDVKELGENYTIFSDCGIAFWKLFEKDKDPACINNTQNYSYISQHKQ